MTDPALPKRPRRGFLSGLAGFISLGIAITAAMRVFGVIRSLPLWQQRAYPAWVMAWLMAVGLLSLALGLASYYLLRVRPKAWMPLFWAVNLLVLLLYWLERLLLWVPAERGGNILFVAAMHLLWLVLMGLISLQARGKEPNDG